MSETQIPQQDVFEVPEDAPGEASTAETSETPQQVNLNTATKSELVSLPRVGRILAQRIIEARPISSFEALAAIPGLSAASLEVLRPLVTLETAPEAPQSAEVPSEEVSPETEEAARVRAAFDELEALESSLLEEDTGELQPLPAAWEDTPLEPPSTAAPPPEIAAEAEEPQPEAAAPPPPAAEVSQAAPAPGISRTRALGMTFVASLFTMLLSIVFTLAVLAVINGDLRYASPVSVQRVARNVRAIQEQMQSTQQEINGLRTRLDNMDALSGRVSTLEEQSGALQQDIQSLNSDLQSLGDSLESLDAGLASLDTQMQNLQEEQGKYQTFFEKLTQTLNELFGNQPAGATPEAPSESPSSATPLPSPTQMPPTETPLPTATPAP